ncbi:hypothetical protein [Flavivirga rizhaonensis]|uniref:HTH luxR-type domain-containing protein n=1 Tax=Flavivirga rizhaonensis TaxID=2559571 RepID=A0A4S1E1D1_9FLAO|nr:hypothetical protein [Flavivirga rizhaonensis]TGV04481.1 hypothetical protein EM932_02855 [Flavivirga rizhaonensis]
MEYYILKLFSNKELEYLRLKYQGANEEEIAKELQFKYKREHSNMETIILNKLSVNNWYNAFRKAFNLQLLNRKDFLSIDIKEEVSVFSTKIKDALLSKELNEKEKELKVYLMLLSFYSKIEYNCLLKN